LFKPGGSATGWRHRGERSGRGDDGRHDGGGKPGQQDGQAANDADRVHDDLLRFLVSK
jgi:hypothetical protein